MLERLQRALQSDGRFAAWQVSEARGRSHQRYQVFDRVEARRVVEQHVTEVRVHVAHKDGDKDVLGDSSFTVVDADADLGALLDAAHARARLVKNRPWTLPGASEGGAAVVQAVDPRIVESPDEACEDVAASIVRGVGAGKAVGAELSASEVYCDYRRVHLVNSRGLDLSREETHAYTEYVLLQKSAGQDEVEAYQSKRARRLSDFDLEHDIQSDIEATLDGARAGLPETGLVDVVIGGQGIEELFDAFIAHAAGAAKFEGWTRFQEGAAVVADVQGDKLTLSSDATLPLGLGTFSFDDVGLPGARIDVIRDGVFNVRACDQRLGCWLGQKPTGTWGNTVVQSGKSSEAELLVRGARPLYHLTRFSQLSPHGTTGAFSGEIRLGHRVDDGKRVPIRGGSISGNVFAAFARARFSAERAIKGRTHAPRAVRLDGVQITGG